MQVKQSRFTLMLLGIIAIGVLILVGGVVLWQLQSTKTKDITKQVQAKSRKYDQILADLGGKDKDLKELDRIRISLAVLDKNLADFKYMPSYLRQIQDTAAKTGNHVMAIAPDDVELLELKKSPFALGEQTQSAVSATAASTTKATPQGKVFTKYRVQGIKLDIDGTYVSLVRLLDEFRRFPKMIYVESLSLSPGKDGVGLKVGMQTYAIIAPDQYTSPDEKSTSRGVKEVKR